MHEVYGPGGHATRLPRWRRRLGQMIVDVEPSVREPAQRGSDTAHAVSLLRITAAGLKALGIEPAAAQQPKPHSGPERATQTR